MSTDQQESTDPFDANHPTPDDPSDYSQLRRMRSIHDSRERVLQKRREAKDLLAYGEIGEIGANSIIREAVTEYIVDVEQVEDGETWEYYWEEYPLGVQRVDGVGRRLEFTGLQSVVNAPEQYTFEWQEHQEAPPGYDVHPGGAVSHHSTTVQIDDRILMAAYRACNKFLADINLDLQFNENDEEVHFDYSDLLQPGEEDPR